MQYSQFGQGEYLLYLSSILCETMRTVVDIGAHTPHRLSNSRCFLEAGYKGLLVESNSKYSNDWNNFVLENNIDATVVNKRIEYKNNSIDSLLEEFFEPNEIAVLFLDIDGSEYLLLDGMKKHRPKFICVEYDNSYPLGIDYIPTKPGHGRRYQASSLAMFKLMKSMNYLYIQSYFQDHIFIDKELYEHLPLTSENFPAGDLHFFRNAPNHLFSYDSVLLNQSENDASLGVNFLASKVHNLIMNGQLIEAQQYFHHLELVLLSYGEVIKAGRSSNYFKAYQKSSSEFCDRFRRLFTSMKMV